MADLGPTKLITTMNKLLTRKFMAALSLLATAGLFAVSGAYAQAPATTTTTTTTTEKAVEMEKF